MRSLNTLAGLGLLTALIAAAPQPSGRVAHPLAGKWTIEYERGRRIMNGEATAVMGKATLEIAERGDSLIGTLTNEATAGGPTSPAMLIAGTGTGTSATLGSSAASRINQDGEERTITISMNWELKVDGDNLSGTMARVIADMPDMGTPGPVKGTRVK